MLSFAVQKTAFCMSKSGILCGGKPQTTQAVTAALTAGCRVFLPVLPHTGFAVMYKNIIFAAVTRHHAVSGRRRLRPLPVPTLANNK